MQRKTTSFRSDMVEGLHYVLQHPVIRSIAIIAALDKDVLQVNSYFIGIDKTGIHINPALLKSL